jgi:hypothetical protein
MFDHIINPRCDECGISVNPKNPLLGPHLCEVCKIIVSQRVEKDFAEMRAQKKRSFHIVKLPEEMIKK